GSTVTVDTAVVLPAGRVEVTSAGALVIGASGLIDVSGLAQDFQGQTRYAPAGSIVLQAGGSLTAAPGSVLDVSGAGGGGSAGDITLASGGALAFDGDARATSAAGQPGGSFSVDAAQAQDLVALNRRLETSGFSRVRSYRVRQGDLSFGAGETITAHA